MLASRTLSPLLSLSCTVAVGIVFVPLVICTLSNSHSVPCSSNWRIDQRLDVFVEDFLLLVRQRLELHERGLDLLVGQVVAQLRHAILERVPAGMLAQHQRVLGNADASPGP